MKTKWNEFARIAILIIIISIIGISYTIFLAFQHNGGDIYTSYGIKQTITGNLTLTFFQILIITLLSIGLVGSIMYLFYSHGGKIHPEKLFNDSEKGIIYLIETVLITIILVLVIVIPVNVILDNKQPTTNSINYPQIEDNYRANYGI